MKNNNTCEKCGRTLDTTEENVCFKCWLQDKQDSLEEEENLNINSHLNNNTPKNVSAKKQYFLKNIGWIIVSIIGVLIIVCATLFDMIKIFSNFIDIANNIGNGNLIVGIIVLSLAFWGAVQIFRGFCEMCDSGKIASTLNAILTIAGYIALLYAVS